MLVLFVMLIMELSLLYNAKQLANYAAFCAARTAAVYGVDSAATGEDAPGGGDGDEFHCVGDRGVTPARSCSTYGVSDPDQTVQVPLQHPRFRRRQTAEWLARLANAYVRTGEPTCDIGTAPGKTRKHVEVNVTYIYRCTSSRLGTSGAMRDSTRTSTCSAASVLRATFSPPSSCSELLAMEHADSRPRGDGLLGRVAAPCHGI